MSLDLVRIDGLKHLLEIRVAPAVLVSIPDAFDQLCRALDGPSLGTDSCQVVFFGRVRIRALLDELHLLDLGPRDGVVIFGLGRRRSRRFS